MKRKYFINFDKKGYVFLNGIEITALWYDFFARLHIEQEKDCSKIFIKRYGKKIVK